MIDTNPSLPAHVWHMFASRAQTTTKGMAERGKVNVAPNHGWVGSRSSQSWPKPTFGDRQLHRKPSHCKKMIHALNECDNGLPSDSHVCMQMNGYIDRQSDRQIGRSIYV